MVQCRQVIAFINIHANEKYVVGRLTMYVSSREEMIKPKLGAACPKSTSSA